MNKSNVQRKDGNVARKISIALVFSSLLAFIPILLVFDYFFVVRDDGGQLYQLISGVDAVFSPSGIYERDYFLLIAYCIACAGVLFMLAFTIWFVFAKKFNPWMFLVEMISCLFLIIAMTACILCALTFQEANISLFPREDFSISVRWTIVLSAVIYGAVAISNIVIILYSAIRLSNFKVFKTCFNQDIEKEIKEDEKE